MLEEMNVENFDLESIVLGYDRKANWRLNNPADEALKVVFFNKPVLLRAKSIKEKRPVFESKEYVKIRVDAQTEVVRPKTEEDTHRFAKQYEDFKRNTQPEVSGTPIEYLKNLDVSSRATCKSIGINTVEALMNVAPEKKIFLGDKAEDWIAAAKKYLESEDSSISGLIEKENIELRQANILAQQQLADLKQLLAAEEKTKKVKDAKNSPSTASGDS